jgi:hypothetical protein
VDEFERELERHHVELRPTYDQLKQAWVATVPHRPLDLERLYELLSWIDGEEMEPPIPLALAPGFPPRSRATDLLLWDLKKLIQSRCLGFGPLTQLEPLVDFARAFPPLTILSLNYDTCVETLLDKAAIPWTDGFPREMTTRVPWSLPDLSIPHAAHRVRLIKLHGSASWYQPAPGWMQRGMGTTQHGVGLGLGSARTMTAEAMVVYPTLHKALADGPFPVLLSVAQQALAASTLCIAIGYAFGDIHIRRLVLDAFSTNPHLKLVVVNPAADAVIDLLLGEPGAKKLISRLGVPSLERSRKGYYRGFIENALREGWLLEQCRSWLDGAPLAVPEPPPRRARHDGNPWRLRLEVDGGVKGLARRGAQLAFAEKKSGHIKTLDLERNEVQVLSREFLDPQGLAWDEASGSLFVVENVYRLCRGFASLALRPPRLSRQGASGIGRVWELREAARFARPVTSIRFSSLLSSPGSLIRAARFKLGPGELWRLLQGALRWPTSVLVEQSGTSLLVTQATRLTRVNLKTQELRSPFNIPLCVNLEAFERLDDQTLWMIDAGLFPNGEGRWMRGNLQTGKVEVLAQGWHLLSGITYLRRQGLALLSFGGEHPHGQIVALQPDHPTAVPVHRWIGLDGPGSLCPAEDERSVFVATRRGIIEIEV